MFKPKVTRTDTGLSVKDAISPHLDYISFQGFKSRDERFNNVGYYNRAALALLFEAFQQNTAVTLHLNDKVGVKVTQSVKSSSAFATKLGLEKIYAWVRDETKVNIDCAGDPDSGFVVTIAVESKKATNIISFPIDALIGVVWSDIVSDIVTSGKDFVWRYSAWRQDSEHQSNQNWDVEAEFNRYVDRLSDICRHEAEVKQLASVAFSGSTYRHVHGHDVVHTKYALLGTLTLNDVDEYRGDKEKALKWYNAISPENPLVAVRGSFDKREFIPTGKFIEELFGA